jgi:hypothetical protein
MTAPAAVEIAAEVAPAGREIAKVEFFYSEVDHQSASIYNTTRDVQIANSPLIRMGESDGVPYGIKSPPLTAGVYSFYGIVTSAAGIRQISEPKTIVVNEYQPGTRQSDGGEYQPPNPEPKTKPCFAARVESLSNWEMDDENDRKIYVEDGKQLDFKLVFKRGEPNAKFTYRWRISDGRILTGATGDSVSVDTTGLGGRTIIANVDVVNGEGCRESFTGRGNVVQEKTSVYKMETFLKPSRFWSEAFASLGDFDPDIGDFDIYMVSYGGKPFCSGEAEINAEIAKDLLKEGGLTSIRIFTVAGGYAKTRTIKVLQVPKGEKPTIPPGLVVDERAIRPCSPQRLEAAHDILEKENSLPVAQPYKNCPGVAEKLTFINQLHIPQEGDREELPEEFESGNRINFCPFNVDDPLNIPPSLMLPLDLRTGGVYWKGVKSKYFTSGGTITEKDGDFLWDLGPVKDVPGYYTAVVEVTDDCGGTNIVSKTLYLTNYCSPKLEGTWDSNESDIEGNALFRIGLKQAGETEDPDEGLKYKWRMPKGEKFTGQGTRSVEMEIAGAENAYLETAVEIEGVKPKSGVLSFTAKLPFTPTELKYDWSAYGPRGLLASGEKTRTVEIDTHGLTEPVRKIELSVRISGYRLLRFSAEPAQWIKGWNPGNLGFAWNVSQGTIVGGLGTSTILVDVGDLPQGAKVIASVHVDGTDPTSTLQTNIVGRVGETPDGEVSGLRRGAPPGISRRASEKPGTGETGNGTAENTDGGTVHVPQGPVTAPSPVPSPGPTPPPSPGAGEREYVRMKWPKESDKIYVQQAFPIKVVYDRTAEKLEVKNADGEEIIALTSKNFDRMMFERWGPNREVNAQVRLRSAGLYESEKPCSPACPADYQSLNDREVSWEFSVTARDARSHSFTLELWIKPGNGGESEVKVWTSEDKKITILPEMPTRGQLYTGLGVVSLAGICGLVWGVRFGNFTLWIGDKVRGDKVAGNKVGRDLVYGNKTEVTGSENVAVTNVENTGDGKGD